MTIVLNTFWREQVETDSRVHAAHAEVPVERADVAEFFVELAQIAKVSAELFRSHGGIFPTFPRDRLAGDEGSRAESGLADRPNTPRVRVVGIELGGRRTGLVLELLHQLLGFAFGLFAALAPELHQ